MTDVHFDHATPGVDLRRAADRFTTRIDWLHSEHSFSFGHHRDPANTHHGLLLVNNDDRVRAGAGFSPHSHRDMEIVTWVLSGSLEHRDSAGNHGVITPGAAQRMSAGRGITHSEMNASATEDVDFVQMWVLPDTLGIDPGYEQRDVSEALDRGDLVPVASGRHPDAGVRIHQRDATLWAARVGAGQSVTVPDDGHVHVFVPLGSGDLDGAESLDTGDAVRLTAAGERQFTAGADGAELLVWATAWPADMAAGGDRRHHGSMSEMPVGTTEELDRLEVIVSRRRTHLLMDRETAVPDELVSRLCNLAMWAPNHKKTWPWRFAVCTGEGRSRLGTAFVDDMAAAGIGDEGKRTKTLTKYLRAPTIVVVGCGAHEHPTFHDENRDAVSAGIQNLLLGATATGLASFWSTAPVIDGPSALSLCGFASDDRIIGVIYLGWPTGTADVPRRPPAPLTRVTG